MRNWKEKTYKEADMRARMTVMTWPPVYPLVRISFPPYQTPKEYPQNITNITDPTPNPVAIPLRTLAFAAILIDLLYLSIAFFSPVKDATYVYINQVRILNELQYSN